MPSFSPKPFAKPSSGSSGITIALCETKSSQHIRIGMSEAAQTMYFGGPLNAQTDALRITLSNDPGKNHIMTITLASKGVPDAFEVSTGIKGSLSIKLTPWGALAKGKRPSAAMTVVGGKIPKDVLVKLPEWARPAPLKIGQGKGLME